MDIIPQVSGSSWEELTTFSCFPELPTELRLKIWNFCLPPPRILYIETKNGHRKEGLPGFKGWFIASARFIVDDCECNTDCIPPLLHVNREAREVGMASYDLAFGNCHRAGTAYVNFEKDTINFTQASSISVAIFLGGSFWGADGAEKIRNLEFKVERHMWDMAGFCWDNVRRFIGFGKLNLVIDDNEIDVENILELEEKLRVVAVRHPELKVADIEVLFETTPRRHLIILEHPSIRGSISE